MLETDPPVMNAHPYSEINPYYLIYCNMNIRITEDVSREAAENVVRQIGYLHNAMGCVFKDLIKIVAFRFPEQNPMQNGQQPQQRPPQPPPNTMGNSNRQPMDIQSDHSQPLPRPSRPNKPRQQQGRSVNEPVLRGQALGVVIEDVRKDEGKPATVDIFDEFAYSKDPPVEGNKNKDIIKMGLAKVIEGVQKKRKESKADEREERRDREEKEAWGQEGQRRAEKSLKEQREEREREKRPQPSGNSMRQLLNKSMEPREEEPDIFSEFVYESKPQDQPLPPPPLPLPQSLPSPVPQEKGESRDQQSKLWQFLRQKQTPAVYEISDDEDNH